MRVEIDDDGHGALSVTVRAGSGYSPDVMKDLAARAVEAYEEAVALRGTAPATSGDEGSK